MIYPLPDTTYTLPLYYKESYFAQDSLLHPELVVEPSFDGVKALPYALWRDDWVTLLLLLMFLVLVYLYHHIRRFFIYQVKDFFNKPHECPVNMQVVEGSSYFLLTLLLSLVGSISFFCYTAKDDELPFIGEFTPYVLLGIYFVCWVAYFAIRNLLTLFVNWVFFRKKERQIWGTSSSFLTSLEALVLFPLILVTVYFHVSTIYGGMSVLLVVIIVKLLCLYKYYVIFFRKMYGILHLFVYFCALDLTPLVAIWIVLSSINSLLI